MSIDQTHEVTPQKKHPRASGASDPRTLTGFTPVTTKTQAQAMSVNGRQFAASFRINSIGAAGGGTDVAYFAFQTPPTTPVTISNIEINGQYINAEFRMFRDGAFTGGTPAPVYNNNDIDQTLSESVFTGAVTITTEGVQFAEPSYLIGAASVGNRTQVTKASAMGDRILQPGKIYIGKMQNIDASATGPIAIVFNFSEAEIVANA